MYFKIWADGLNSKGFLIVLLITESKQNFFLQKLRTLTELHTQILKFECIHEKSIKMYLAYFNLYIMEQNADPSRRTDGHEGWNSDVDKFCIHNGLRNKILGFHIFLKSIQKSLHQYLMSLAKTNFLEFL